MCVAIGEGLRTNEMLDRGREAKGEVVVSIRLSRSDNKGGSQVNVVLTVCRTDLVYESKSI